MIPASGLAIQNIEPQVPYPRNLTFSIHAIV